MEMKSLSSMYCVFSEVSGTPILMWENTVEQNPR